MHSGEPLTARVSRVLSSTRRVAPRSRPAPRPPVPWEKQACTAPPKRATCQRRLEEYSGDGYFSSVSRACQLTLKIRNSCRKLMRILPSITMFEATFRPKTIEKAATRRNLRLVQASSFYLKPLIKLKSVTAFDLDDAKSRPLVLESGYRLITVRILQTKIVCRWLPPFAFRSLPRSCFRIGIGSILIGRMAVSLGVTESHLLY